MNTKHSELTEDGERICRYCSAHLNRDSERWENPADGLCKACRAENRRRNEASQQTLWQLDIEYTCNTPKL